jgi:hypothetical protein
MVLLGPFEGLHAQCPSLDATQSIIHYYTYRKLIKASKLNVSSKESLYIRIIHEAKIVF